MLTRQMDDGVVVSFQYLPRQKIGERRTRLKDTVVLPAAVKPLGVTQTCHSISLYC